MNSYHDGDVYPVDVSTESSSNDGNVITQARQSGGTESNHGSRSTASVIKNALSNPALYLSDIYYSSQYDPNSLQYMLDFFRHVAQTIPASPPSPSTESAAHEAIPIEPMQGSARDMLQDRAGIIVLREDLDFYAIPPRKDIEQTEMMEVKRAAGKALLKQDGIFSGLRKSEEPGTTEQHLIEMLTAGYVNSTRTTELASMLTLAQRLQPRRSMGPSRRRAQQSSHLQHRSRQTPNRHSWQRSIEQRSWHGPKVATILEKASQKMLVGRCRFGKR